MSYTYDYPRPAVTVDAVVLREREELVEVLLIKRKNEPFQASWALPGGFLDQTETLEDAVARELKEETRIEGIELMQFKVYSEPNRDPRGRTVSVVYIAVLKEEVDAKAGDDATTLKWFAVNELPKLAFDHRLIINEVLQYIKGNF